MLKAIPKSWFSWNFSLEGRAGVAIADVLLSSWRERGGIAMHDGPQYSVHRQGVLGPFLLEGRDGSEVARAMKPTAFRREFLIEHGDRRYTLRALSSLGRAYGVFGEGGQVGEVLPVSWLSRRATVEISEDVPVVLQAFLVWLALLLWKRAAASSGA